MFNPLEKLESLPEARGAEPEGRIVYGVDWGKGRDETAVSAIRCLADGTAMVLASETGEKAEAIIAFLKACGAEVAENEKPPRTPEQPSPVDKDSLTAEAGDALLEAKLSSIESDTLGLQESWPLRWQGETSDD